MTAVARQRLVLLLPLLAAIPWAAAAAAQDPELKRGPPPAADMICSPAPNPVQATAADSATRAGVERLTGAATQAMILGDLEGAAEFLDRALRADPGAAEAAYLRGRIAREREDAAAAAPWFCRYLALAPSGPSAEEARRRLEEAAAAGAGRPAYSTFETALALYDAGDLAGADARLDSLLAARPGVAEAVYNRALIAAATERPGPARAYFEGYLALRPDAPDRAVVEELLVALTDGPRAPSPTSAFLMGALVPGGGQYYTRRPWRGALVTGAAVAALGAGVLHERTTVRCLDAAVDGDCPPAAIAGRETERPLLVAGIATAAGLALVAAVEAALHAGRDARTRYLPPTPAGGPARLDLSLIRLRF